MKVRASLLLALGASVALGIAILVWWTWSARTAASAETAASVAAARERRTTALIEVAPAPLPQALPIVGDDSRDADGYPTAYVDKAGLRSLLWRRRYAELTRYFTEFQDRFEADPRFEYWPADAGDAFASAEPELGARLDAWVAASPDSFAPYFARGVHWQAVGFSRRGEAVAKKTAAEDFTAMGEANARALVDLGRALTLRPKLLAALRPKLRIHASSSDHHGVESTLAQSILLCKTCFLVRGIYQYFAVPRWGGSYALMKAVADSVDPKDNARFRWLEGYADADRADLLMGEKKYDEALRAIDAALASGQAPLFLLQRGEILAYAKRFEDALTTLDRAYALRPNDERIQFKRAYAEFMLKRYEAAGLDLLAALRIDPTDRDGRWLHESVFKGLVREGTERNRAGKRDEALRLVDLAAELAPKDRLVNNQRAWIILGSEKPDIPALQQACKDHPDDFRLYQQLDYSLAMARRGPEIIALWNDFIARHPDHGRAYLERGGAYYNLGKRSEAHADVTKACELGLTEGCEHAKDLR